MHICIVYIDTPFTNIYIIIICVSQHVYVMISEGMKSLGLLKLREAEWIGIK